MLCHKQWDRSKSSQTLELKTYEGFSCVTVSSAWHDFKLKDSVYNLSFWLGPVLEWETIRQPQKSQVSISWWWNTQTNGMYEPVPAVSFAFYLCLTCIDRWTKRRDATAINPYLPASGQGCSFSIFKLSFYFFPFSSSFCFFRTLLLSTVTPVS